MITDLKLLNEAFAEPTSARARVLPGGFAVDGATFSALRGRIASWTLVRKLFREERLVCWSNGGERSASGRLCADCPSRGECGRRLRLFLEEVEGEHADGGRRLGGITLEMNFTSGRNFLAYAQRLACAQLEVQDVPARLTVIDRGGWGEVCFVQVRPLGSAGEDEHAS